MSGQDSAVSHPAVLLVSFISNPSHSASARLTILNETEPALIRCSALALILAERRVQPGCCFDKHVLHARQRWNLGLGRRITAQLIGEDFAWHRARTQHMLEETFGGGFVAPLLQQDVEFGAMFVDCTPQELRLAAKRDEHLVEVPCTAWLEMRRFHPVREARAELFAPASITVSYATAPTTGQADRFTLDPPERAALSCTVRAAELSTC
jgi:hypothetical protein